MLFGPLSILLGLIIGSFLNVCIYRLPRGMSIVIPRSHCPDCGRFVAWYDNIPLLSFLFLMGRCRQCRKKIPWRYPLVELLSGALSYLVFLKFGAGLPYLFYFVLLAAPLVVITLIDLEHLIIPDLLSLPGIGVGLLSSLFLSEGPLLESLIDSVLGLLSGGLALFLVSWVYEKLRRQEGIGGGDIKLAAMLGAFFGWKGVVLILFFSSLLGSLTGLFLILVYRKGLKTVIPYGPFLSAGALFYLFLGPELVSWYLGLTQKLYN